MRSVSVILSLVLVVALFATMATEARLDYCASRCARIKGQVNCLAKCIMEKVR